MITRETQRAGEFVRMSAENAVLATYYRNNVLHLVAMPSLMACCFIANAELRAADIQRFAGRIYPYIAAELFLRWSEAEVPSVVDEALAALGRCGLLEAAGEGRCARRHRDRLERRGSDGERGRRRGRGRLNRVRVAVIGVGTWQFGLIAA